MKAEDNKQINLEKTCCPKCGGTNTKIIIEGKDFLYKVPGVFFVSECMNCGLWYQNPRPSKNELSNLYPNNYIPHIISSAPNNEPFSPHSQKLLTFRKRLIGFIKRESKKFISWFLIRIGFNRKWESGVDLDPAFVKDGNLLEIGCADGRRLAALRTKGWDNLHGIELVATAAEKARSQGFHIEEGMVEEMLQKFPDNYFDVIVSSMVLEHLYNPFQIVCIIASKLKSGGQFLFSTITRDSLDAKIYGKYWGGLDFPRHMVHFRKKDIEGMLKPYFINIKKFHQFAPQDFIRSSSWRIEDKKTTLFDRFILKAGMTFSAEVFNKMVAKLNLTCRVSYKCIKK